MNCPVHAIHVNPSRLAMECIPAPVDEGEIIGFIFDEIYPDCRHVCRGSSREKPDSYDPDHKCDERSEDQGADDLGDGDGLRILFSL